MVVLIPCSDYRFTGRTAAVRDAQTDELVWFPASGLTLRDGLLCVRAVKIDDDSDAGGPIAVVELPGGVFASVRRAHPIDLPPATTHSPGETAGRRSAA